MEHKPHDVHHVTGPLSVETMREGHARASLCGEPPNRILASESTLKKIIPWLVNEVRPQSTWGTHPETGKRFYIPMFDGCPFAVDETLPHNQIQFVNDREPENENANCTVDLTLDAGAQEYPHREVQITEREAGT